jgi:hypothetical protein
MWSDFALMGVKVYASSMATGLQTVSRLVPAAGASPAPAIRRSRPVKMWPAAGSFGSNNAVGAWVDATQAMMGGAPPRAGFPFAFPWVGMPLPWSGTAGFPSLPIGMPWAAPFGSPVPGVRIPFLPFAAPASLTDPFQLMRLMNPMLDAMTTSAARSFRYH